MSCCSVHEKFDGLANFESRYTNTSRYASSNLSLAVVVDTNGRYRRRVEMILSSGSDKRQARIAKQEEEVWSSVLFTFLDIYQVHSPGELYDGTCRCFRPDYSFDIKVAKENIDTASRVSSLNLLKHTFARMLSIYRTVVEHD